MKRLFLIFLLGALFISVTAATTITVPACEVRTYKEVIVSSDACANGLSGYNLTFSVADPTKAEITEVSFPSWATISTCGALPASSVTCTAADLDAQVQAGSSCQLATVRVRSIAAGDTTLGVYANTFDDDVGGAISPSLSNGTLSSKTSARVMATATFTPVSTQAYQNIYQSLGGNTSPANETAAMINWTAVIEGSLSPYTLQLGYLAFVIIFAIPFVLMWIMQQDMVPAGVAGIIIGGFMLAWLPVEYSLLAGIFVVLALLTIVYSLLKDRM
jgi:hypothetical protein